MQNLQKRVRPYLFLSFLLALFSQQSFAATHKWELQYSKNNLDVYTRVVDGTEIKAFKAVTTVNAPMQSVLSVIGDIKDYPNWFHLCKFYKFVTQPNAAGKYVSYYVVNAPWPLKDRDIYMQNVVTQNPKTLAVTIKSTGAPHYGPEVDKYTRVPEVTAHWKFTPLGDDKTRIEMVGHGRPGGIIPLWIANMVVTDVPKKSFRNLQKILKENKYDLSHAGQLKSVFPNIHFPPLQVGMK